MKKTFFLLPIICFLFLPSIISFADNATPLNTNVQFQDLGDSSFVKWSITIVSINGNYTCPFVCAGYSKINFTNIASTTKTNPSQTFGTEIQIANTTITNIDSNNVYFTVNPKNSSNPNLFYYFLTNVPPQINMNNTSITSSSYLLNPSLYPSCKTNCVLQTSNYLEIKALPTSPNNIVVCVLVPCLTIEPANSTDGYVLLGVLIMQFILSFIGIFAKRIIFALINIFPMIVSILNVVQIQVNPTIFYGNTQFLATNTLYIILAFGIVFNLVGIIVPLMAKKFV